MKINIIVESTAFEHAMIAASRALDRALPEVYRDELGRLMHNIITVRTPPKTRSQGLKVVRGQILNTTVPVHEKFLDILEKAYGNGPVDTVYKSAGKKDMKIAYKRVFRTLEGLHLWHQSHRRPYDGRTYEYKVNKDLYAPTKAFVPKMLFNRYVRYMQKGLGQAKGGWWPAARHVYTRRPPAGWITRKAGQGSAVVDLRPGAKQTFIAINRSPWAKRKREAERAVKDALRFRARTIPVAVERELKRRYSLAGFIVRGSDILGAGRVGR